MESVFNWIARYAGNGVITTMILVALVFLTRVYALRKLRQTENLTSDLRRRWMVQVRRGSWLLVLFGGAIIWASEVQPLAVSLLAFAVAIVLATKELILCVSGAVLKGSARSFEIGDRIEIGDLRGDVFDHTLLTTTLLEVGPGRTVHQHTGRKITIPNSILLTTPVMNDSAVHEYVIHHFSVPMKLSESWREARIELLQAAVTECSGFIDEARKYMEKMGEKEGIESLSVEPRVTIRLPEPDRIDLVVRVPARVRRRGRVEQAILDRYFATGGSKVSLSTPVSSSED